MICRFWWIACIEDIPSLRGLAIACVGWSMIKRVGIKVQHPPRQQLVKRATKTIGLPEMNMSRADVVYKSCLCTLLELYIGLSFNLETQPIFVIGNYLI